MVAHSHDVETELRAGRKSRLPELVIDILETTNCLNLTV